MQGKGGFALLVGSLNGYGMGCMDGVFLFCFLSWMIFSFSGYGNDTYGVFGIDYC